MAILVTGCAGFIGFHLTQKLLADGHEIIGIDSLNDYYDVALKNSRLELIKKSANTKNFHFYQLDICDKHLMESQLKPHLPAITHIIHLAAYAGVRFSMQNPYPYQKSNIEGLLNIMEIARGLSNLQRFIFASSSSVYGADSAPPFSIKSPASRPLSYYGATKKAGEAMLYSYASLYKIPAVALRFFTVYGPFGRPDMAYFSFTKNIFSGKKINVFNNGNMKRDFTYIDDIITGIIAAMNFPQKPGADGVYFDIFNLGNNKPELVLDMISLIEKSAGKKAEVEFKPAPPGDMQETCADLTESKNALNFSPKTRLSEGIPNFVNWFKNYYQL